MILKYRSLSKYHFYSTKASNKQKYTNTILSPQTKLPLHLKNEKVIQRDRFINNLSYFKELYLWQQQHCSDPPFVLHDGPPYANGTLHMGHAINKILKDAIVRFKIINGQKVDYKPGWDCHGLPIELKAMSTDKQKLTPIEIRNKARNFAKNTMETQKSTFQSWGVVGDWDNAYLTCDNKYIQNELEQFYKLYEKGLVYRDVKPVYWSPSSRTALAEAELEYNPKHKSTAVYVKFKIAYLPFLLEENIKSIYALVWTTTPWTLPCNEAICFNQHFTYSIVQRGDSFDFFIIAANLVEEISKTLGESLKVITTFNGTDLEGSRYFYPFSNKKELPFISSDHASNSIGTGLVHTAPAHGPDDFVVALKNKLPISSAIDENGCYTNEFGANLSGLFVLSEGTKVVLDLLKENIVYKSDYIHSYPYDWRTKKPVIIRTSKQWFLDTNKIKLRATELLENINFLPQTLNNAHKSNLSSQIFKRPYWCISRQRCWGVPIPVFYEISTGKPLINRDIITHLCNLLEKHNFNYWWQLPLSELFPKHCLNTFNLSLDDIERGNDIFDIWLDSGLTWSYVLKNDQVADMYLEGNDQFTGWFQSSLMASVALRDIAPYKSVYVHGFVVDEHGLKMSKSLGNVIDPIDIVEGKKKMKTYGVDTLRWWVVCHASSDSMTHVSENVLTASSDEVQKIRSVLRFAIGALFDYKKKSIEYTSLGITDKYMLHLLWSFNKQITKIYKTYEFKKIASSVINLLTNPISALYYVAIKDRLYCNDIDNNTRLAAQFVLVNIFNIVARTVAPIVPHLVEELYIHFPQKERDSIFHMKSLILNEAWCNPELCDFFENVILHIKKEIHKVLGQNTLDSNLKIQLNEDLFNKLQKLTEENDNVLKELIDIFQISQISIVPNASVSASDKFLISTEKSRLYMCDRCRRVFSECENDLCKRCSIVCNDLKNKTAVLN